MGTLLMHIVYFMVIVYGYRAVETYQVQRSLGVEAKKAWKSGLLWPKYYLS